jgi:hypothetical protein
MKTSFLSKIGLPEDVSFARRDTRLNGKKLDPKALGEKCGTGHFIGGVSVTSVGPTNRLHIECRTVENGTLKILCDMETDREGTLISGKANVFAWKTTMRDELGDFWSPMDTEYYLVFITEFFCDAAKGNYWDEIIC